MNLMSFQPCRFFFFFFETKGKGATVSQRKWLMLELTNHFSKMASLDTSIYFFFFFTFYGALYTSLALYICCNMYNVSVYALYLQSIKNSH